MHKIDQHYFISQVQLIRWRPFWILYPSNIYFGKNKGHNQIPWVKKHYISPFAYVSMNKIDRDNPFPIFGYYRGGHLGVPVLCNYMVYLVVISHVSSRYHSK